MSFSGPKGFPRQTRGLTDAGLLAGLNDQAYGAFMDPTALLSSAFMGGGLPGFSSSSSSSATAISGGTFISGEFNPSFGGSPEQRITSSVVPMALILMGGLVAWKLLK